MSDITREKALALAKLSRAYSQFSCDETDDYYDADILAFMSFANAVRADFIKELLGMDVEPAAHQFQDREGKWHNFTGPKHYAATVEDGSWPIRELLTTTQAAAMVLQEREKAFDKGWSVAANWSGRDDLISDIGSPAYERCKDAAIRNRKE